LYKATAEKVSQILESRKRLKRNSEKVANVLTTMADAETAVQLAPCLQLNGL